MFKKKILPIIMFLLLLFGLAYFPYIPINLFRIPYDTFNLTMRTLYMLFCDVGYILVLFLIYKNKLVKDFKEYLKNFKNNFETSFKYYFIGVIIMIVTNLILTFFVSGANANNEEAVREMIDSVPLYMLFSVAIYAPITEELIFRHCIKDSVMGYGDNKFIRIIYILISGIVFGAMHVLGQVSSPLDYLYIISYSALGISFAALYSKTDNIFNSIVMHSLHNTITICLYLFANGVI